jgi:site-specific DNA-adenine methylase
MFSYYGAKAGMVKYYQTPVFDNIVEPFAGSAQYSLKYWDRDVLLIDKYDKVVLVWQLLQKMSVKDVLGLPDFKRGDVIDRNKCETLAHSYLLGFMTAIGKSQPGMTVSPWGALQYERRKKNIANNLYKIKHWKIKCGDYKDLQNTASTWFIDPPYFIGGSKYAHNKIDYTTLSEWCKTRVGQIIVCENTKANWLPFKPLKQLHGCKHVTMEATWNNIAA